MIKRVPRKLKKYLKKIGVPIDMYIEFRNDLFFPTPRGTKYMAERCAEVLSRLNN